MTNPEINLELHMPVDPDVELAELSVDPAIAGLMHRTRARRERKRHPVSLFGRMVRRLLLAVLVLGSLTACGPPDLTNAPLTPVTHAATVVPVPAPTTTH